MLLTNLPPRVSALQIADVYRQRWQIETVFFELDRLFEGEVETLGHPRAALLMFCLSLIAYNALSLTRMALAATHGAEEADKISDYYLAQVVVGDWRALDIFAAPADWSERFGGCSAKQLARALKSLAKHVNLKRLEKTTRGPKKKPPKRTSAKRKPHVSTANILKSRKRIE